jgi:hypothetical protein
MSFMITGDGPHKLPIKADLRRPGGRMRARDRPSGQEIRQT